MKIRQSFSLIAAIALVLCSVNSTAAEPATDRGAATILDRYVAAIGGYPAWKQIENVRSVTESETFGITRRSTRIEELGSGRVHVVSAGPEGEAEMGFDGTSVWRRAAYGRGVLPDTDWQAKIMRQWKERQPRFWRESGKAYRSAPDETIDGRTFKVVATTEPDEAGIETVVRHYFDPKTHLLERTVRGSREGMQATTIFSDYRKVGSVRIPFRTVSTNPQWSSTTRIIEWAANVTVAPGIFTFDAGQPDLSSIPELKGVDLSKARVYRPGDGNLPPEVAKMIEEARASGDSSGARTVIKAPAPAGEGELAESVRLDAFNVVWKTINDTYWDPTFGGIDWKAIGDRYRPRALAATTSKELHEVLNEMVNQLGQTHFRVIPPERTRTVGSNRPLPGTIGLNYRTIDGQLVVTKVDEGHPAAAAGIRPGFVISAINGRQLTDLQTELIAREPVLAMRPDAALQRAAGAEISGASGTTLEVTLLDLEDRPVTKKLTRAERPLSAMTRLQFESRWLEPGRIGYISISAFFNDAAERVRKAVAEMQEAETIIVDLRGNGGGAGDLAPTIAGMFAREPGSLGVSRLRHGVREFSYEPAAGAFTGELIILIDGGSGSTSEVFAGGLQESKRARLVGSTSRGGVLPSLAALLPTGGVLQHVISDFRTPDGVVLEGRGVIPDIEVSATRDDIITGRDPVLDRAIAAAREEAGGVD